MEVETERKRGQNSQAKSCFKIELTHREMQFIACQLPQGYSIQSLWKQFKRAPKLINGPQLSKEQSQISQVPEIVRNVVSTTQRIKKTLSPVFNKHPIQNQLVTRHHLNRNYTSEFCDQELKSCLRILNLLKNNKTSWPFREPVEPVAMGVPNYLQIVNHPMDLRTVEQTFKANEYRTAMQFHADINRIIRNSYVFNKSNEAFLKLTADFQKYYFKVLSDSHPTRKPRSHNQRGEGGCLQFQKHRSKKSEVKRSKKTSVSQGKMSVAQTVSIQDKKELYDNIRRLNKDDLREMAKLIYPEEHELKQAIDLDQLEVEKIRDIQTYVRMKLAFPSQQSLPLGNPNEHHYRAHPAESSFEIESQSE